MSDCCHAQLPATAIPHPHGSKKLRKIVRVLVRDPVKPASARTVYINQGKPEYVLFTPYRPCTVPGRVPRGLLRAQNCRKLCMLCFQPRLYCALFGSKSLQDLAGPHGMPCDYPRVPTVLALKLSGNFM